MHLEHQIKFQISEESEPNHLKYSGVGLVLTAKTPGLFKKLANAVKPSYDLLLPLINEGLCIKYALGFYGYI